MLGFLFKSLLMSLFLIVVVVLALVELLINDHELNPLFSMMKCVTSIGGEGEVLCSERLAE